MVSSLEFSIFGASLFCYCWFVQEKDKNRNDFKHIYVFQVRAYSGCTIVWPLLTKWNVFSYKLHMWPSTGKPGTTRHPSKKFFLHLQSCRRPDIELSKFYRRSLSRSHYNRPNRSLPSAWNNTFLRNRSIFSRCLRTPRCARFSCRRSHIKR